MASVDLKATLKYDADRIPLPGEARASDAALERCQALAGDYVTVDRAIAYARREADVQSVSPNDLLRLCQHAEGDLALVTWGNTGIETVGYLPDAQRFDVGGYSAVRDMMGDDPEHYDTCTLAAAKDELVGAQPDVICRADADLLPPLDDAWGGL